MFCLYFLFCLIRCIYYMSLCLPFPFALLCCYQFYGENKLYKNVCHWCVVFDSTKRCTIWARGLWWVATESRLYFDKPTRDVWVCSTLLLLLLLLLTSLSSSSSLPTALRAFTYCICEHIDAKTTNWARTTVPLLLLVRVRVHRTRSESTDYQSKSL